MENIAIVLGCSGMGDIISSIPSIRLLHKLYNQKIVVFTHNVDLLKNYPYIEVKYIEEKFEPLEDPKWSVLDTFNTEVDRHPRMDIRQFHASKLGIQLLPEEMSIEFYPDKYEPIDNLPENYVVIHPVKTWPSRTWEEKKWQELTDILNDNGIPVVAVGKKSQELGTYNTQKPVFNLNIKNGLDLTNKLSIHQTWHILNKSVVTVTMDSGILHLAGTTDTGIIQLGSSIDPRLRAPYRKGSQDYKYKYILGECNLFCASNLKYYVKYNGDFAIPPVPFCLEEPKTIGDQTLNDEIYKCHPGIEQVVKETLSMFNKYKVKSKSKILTNSKGVIRL